MSIYATLWQLKFPVTGDVYFDCEWITVTAQGVPAHIGTPTPGHGYEKGDPFAEILPPPLEVDEDGDAPFMRAVVFVTEHTPKGTPRNGQEYIGPLLTLTGAEYARIPFGDLHDRICDRLRGNRPPVIMQILKPDGTTSIIRQRPEPPAVPPS
jgi:hypothetical protein